MYVKPKNTKEKLIDLVKKLAGYLEDTILESDFDPDEYGQKLCKRARKFAEKSDKRRNQIYKEKGK